jgi:L-threonylcarbamoyladenylate synthase
MQNQEVKDIRIITEALKNGEVCLLPTDIGYEVACDGTNSDVVCRVLAMFKTPLSHNYSLIVPHIDQIVRFTRELPEIAEELLNVATTPLILILPTSSGLPQTIIIGKDKVPFRIVSEGITSTILQKLNRPLLTIPASGNYSTITSTIESVPKDIASTVSHHIAPDSKNTFKYPSIIELELSGEIKIIRD